MRGTLKNYFRSVKALFLARLAPIFGLTLLLLLVTFASAWAWPTDSQWIPLPKGGDPILDDHTTGGKDGDNDATGSVNVVPYSGSTPAAYIYNDGTYLFYRIRVDSDPTGSGGQGILQSFGWGFEIDTDQNPDDYEWLIMCDGISSPEVVSLRQNTDKTALGDPSDKAEYVAAEYPMVGNHRIIMADSCTNDSTNPVNGCGTTAKDDRDYFLDFRMPYAVFLAATGITEDSLIRYFVGSSNSTNNLTENGADLLAGSTLYTMGSDFVTPTGTLPPGMSFYDGVVNYADDISGFGDMNLAAPGDTIYIRVFDQDLSTETNPSGTLPVTITSPTGDSERLILTATGVKGKYTGSLPTSSAGNSDGTLYILDNQTATVTYVDSIAANLSQSVDRTDTLLFSAAGTDIGIRKTVDTPVASPGETVTFTVTATNNGPSAITTFTVNDTLPADLTLISATPSLGSYSGGVWTGGALARYASATLVLQASVNGGTNGLTITNTATLSSSTPTDRYPDNDSDSASVTVGGTDLRVTKSVDTLVPTEGDSITYTVRVFNLGPTDTGGVQIEDILPAGVTYTSDNSGGSYDSTTGIWNVDFLANGDGALLRINATVDASTFGQTITNTASLYASDQPDIDPSNNSDSADIKVDFLDLVLTKVARKTSPPPPGSSGSSIVADEGDTVEFTITVDNNGPHDATSIEVTDTLPVGVTYVSSTVSQGTFTSGTGVWNVGSLDDGDDASLTIEVTVDSGTAGQTLLNEAEITAVDQPDSNPGDEYDTATLTVDGTDLQVTKTVSDSTPDPNDTITWSVAVTNNGPNQATNIEITDILPPGITYDSDTATQGSYDAGKQNSTWVWSVGTLNAAASATLTITTTVDAGTTGQTIVNVAMITNADQADPDNSNNVADDFIAVAGTDLSITKTVDDSTPAIGQNVTYTLTVENLGPGNATSVTVNDLLPPEVSYQSDTPSQGTYDNLTGIWTIDGLANGASVTLDIVAQVLNDDGNLVITNTATISATQADPDPNNNTATADINVSATDLDVTKLVDNPTPYEGSNIVYTVTTSNLGSNQATNVEIEDILPLGVSYVSSVPSQGSYAAGLWIVGTVPGNSSATLAITASVDSGTAGSTITNTARVTNLDQIDTDPTNDSASVDILATTPPALPSITILKTSRTDWDPVNKNSNPKAIPGADVIYTLQAINSGPGAVDSDTLVFTDDLPANTRLFVNDLGQGSPVLFLDPDADSGFAFPPQPLNISYAAQADCADYSYMPVADTDGYDANVCSLQVQLLGSFAGDADLADPDSPDFSLEFKMRIQ